MKRYRTKGSGTDARESLGSCGDGVVIEDGVRIFHPENVHLGDDVYVGHDTILEGYHERELLIGDGTWIGPQCHFHAAGGLRVGKNVGVGPGVRVITSVHEEAGRGVPILHSPLRFAAVRIDNGSDIGAGAILLPGAHVGQGAQIGAGAVVSTDIPEYAVAAGVPARVLRTRPSED